MRTQNKNNENNMNLQEKKSFITLLSCDNSLYRLAHARYYRTAQGRTLLLRHTEQTRWLAHDHGTGCLPPLYLEPRGGCTFMEMRTQDNRCYRAAYPCSRDDSFDRRLGNQALLGMMMSDIHHDEQTKVLTTTGYLVPAMAFRRGSLVRLSRSHDVESYATFEAVAPSVIPDLLPRAQRVAETVYLATWADDFRARCPLHCPQDFVPNGERVPDPEWSFDKWVAGQLDVAPTEQMPKFTPKLRKLMPEHVLDHAFGRLLAQDEPVRCVRPFHPESPHTGHDEPRYAGETNPGVINVTEHCKPAPDDLSQVFKRAAARIRLPTEKQSDALLARAIATSGAVSTERGGKAGFDVTGALTSYFVERDTLKVRDLQTGAIICVVDEDPERSSRLLAYRLAVRLLALRNDVISQGEVTTLRQENAPSGRLGPDLGERGSAQLQEAGAFYASEAAKIMQLM